MSVVLGQQGRIKKSGEQAPDYALYRALLLYVHNTAGTIEEQGKSFDKIFKKEKIYAYNRSIKQFGKRRKRTA